jgi:hypothetical protein
LAFNFNNNTLEPPTMESPIAAEEGGAPDKAVDKAPAPQAPQPAPAVPQSAAFIRFRSCRWYQPAENGNAEFCTHREVKPYAGTSGFDADAWCPDCQFYKVRRSPKKRAPNEDFGY